MSLTNDAENEVLNTLFRSGGIYASKSFCLFTGGAGIEADLETGGATAMAHELSGSSVGYARVAKTGNSPFGSVASIGTLTSDEIIEFNMNSGGVSWETASHWGILVSGSLVVWGALTAPVTAAVGEVIRVQVGGLTLSIN